MSQTETPKPLSSTRLLVAQLAAILIGICAVVGGLLGVIAGVTLEVQWLYAVLLGLGPILWLFQRRRLPKQIPSLSAPEDSIPRTGGSRFAKLRSAWLLGLLVGGTSLAMSGWINHKFGDLPPAYHDEFSYLLQARTFLAGRLSVPSHPDAPRLFDQMHVVNEGRFASRYFPGAGAWMAPFVAHGQPYWGHWLAGALTAMLIFWTGRELAGNGVGFLAGMLTALAPGMGLFSNLLLAHHPTLAGLSLFLYTFLRMMRTKHWRDAILAGIGLSFAMHCRPMTAAGVGLPFGIWLLWWLFRGGANSPGIEGRSRLKLAAVLGAPVLAGLLMMFAYNRAITGNGWLTPYQQFTTVYTPRHGYGFDNVVRGEKRLGPRVFEKYDRWAENLTPRKAVHNVLNRLVASWQWTLGIIPLSMAGVVFCLSGGNRDGRWWLIIAAIVSLHAVHIPYWFVGIMGWHYVFESGPLWTLIFAAATQTLLHTWRQEQRQWMGVWWFGIVGCALLSSFVAFPSVGRSRLDAGVDEIAFSRRTYAIFRNQIEQSVKTPALVLIDADPADQHIDFVINGPDFQSAVLYGRFRPRIRHNEKSVREELERIVRLFPDRNCYLYNAEHRQLSLVASAKTER